MIARVEHKHRTGCPVACSLDIIGDHWTLLVIRNLMFLGLHEYKDMLHTEELISSSILTDRLKKLEQAGLVTSIPHPESGRRKLYYLTAMGKDLIHMMTDLVVWANRHLLDTTPLHTKTTNWRQDTPEITSYSASIY
ncbi:MAG: helix-turn-helix domain-containing protein [Candidatus Thiodiazotropha sp.]